MANTELEQLKHDVKEVSFVAMEAINERTERREKRFFAVILVLISLLVLTNLGWLVYEFSMETVEETTQTETVTIDAQQDGGGTNIVGGGDVTYGAES